MLKSASVINFYPNYINIIWHTFQYDSIGLNIKPPVSYFRSYCDNFYQVQYLFFKDIFVKMNVYFETKRYYPSIFTSFSRRALQVLNVQVFVFTRNISVLNDFYFGFHCFSPVNSKNFVSYYTKSKWEKDIITFQQKHVHFSSSNNLLGIYNIHYSFPIEEHFYIIVCENCFFFRTK